ncbi:MAG: nitrilase-related carbon-nitrogen hydrolase [bacterium]
MRVYMSSWHVGQTDHNLRQTAQQVRIAAERNCEMAVFPELFLTGYRGDNPVEELRSSLAQISSRFPQVCCCFGSISEDGSNRQLIMQAGAELARYDKVHLFRPNQEHMMWQSGSSYASFQLAGLRVGMAICNDIRFPEQVRALRLHHGIGLLICPALWPARRDHIWSALLRARAIENNIYVIGCCISSIDNGVELFDGALNHVFDPNGNELHDVERIHTLDLALLETPLVDTRAQHVEISDLQLFG